MQQRPFLLAIILILTFSYCHQLESNFIIKKINSNESLAGYSNAEIIINKSIKQDILKFETLKVEGLKFDLSPDNIITSVSFENSKFEMHTGIKVGSTKNEVLKIYGAPSKENIKLTKGDFQVGNIKGWFYRECSFFLDDQNNVSSIRLSIIEK